MKKYMNNIQKNLILLYYQMARPIFYAILTFITYALIHSVRSCLSYMKVSLQLRPTYFDTSYLGELDMTVLISLAVSLKTLGWIGQRIGHKLFLLIGMGYLSIVIFLMAGLQLKQYNQRWIYVLLYALIGISSCTGWPSCLSIVSLYYPPKNNGFKLCIWNGCSQFGDFLALGLGYILIDKFGLASQYLLIAIALLLAFMIIANWIFLVTPNKQSQASMNEQKKNGKLSQEILQLEQKTQNNQKQLKKSNKKQVQQQQLKESLKSQQLGSTVKKNKKVTMKIKISGHRPTNQVNFLNVWLLPSVASYVLCYGCLKSTNAIITYWLYFYLNSIGINKYPKTITISWSVFIFIGSVGMGYYYNKVINKIGLIFPLAFTALIFLYLGHQYTRSDDQHYLILMMLSGLFFGGPYGLIGSTITLLLGKNPAIKQRIGAVGAIISLMQGFGQFSGAFFVLMVPIIGLQRLFYMPSILCLVSAGILYVQHRKQIMLDERNEREEREKGLQQQRKLQMGLK